MRWFILCLIALFSRGLVTAEPLSFAAQRRTVGQHGTAVMVESKSWTPDKTALIVCDFWDSHTCGNAARRVAEMAPRVAAVVESARQRGVTIIHAPSDCMAHYEGHPARVRAQTTPKPAKLPEGIGAWQYWISPEEEKAGYPVDATDGGNDDTAEEKVAWQKQLEAEGRTGPDRKWPWRQQHSAIAIDKERDLISDRGEEIWSYLEHKQLAHVIIIGVHANMCICGRSFGLRQMARLGKEVVLLRDLTDAMYNPAQKPHVSHYRGTEMVIGHIERWICPTALSSSVFGGKAFEFSGDRRPHLAVMIGEDEYFTWETVPSFCENRLGRDYRLSYILAPSSELDDFSPMSALDTAQGWLISVRRRPLKAEAQRLAKAFVDRGGAIIGIRNASHAFIPKKDQPVAAGREAWQDFDEKVLGGNYQNHLGPALKTIAQVSAPADHPILQGITRDEFPTGGSLYLNTPLRGQCQVLLTGRAENTPQTQPVAWTHRTPAGGKVFYTSLGHVGDFEGAVFPQLLHQAIRWAVPLKN